MVHQDAHGLIKLIILIWLVNLHAMLTRLPTYLLTYHPPTYYLPTCLPNYILSTYLSIYLPTYYLRTYYLSMLCVFEFGFL
jgi:hypothetical protein